MNRVLHQFCVDTVVLNDNALTPVDELYISVLTNDDIVIQGQSKLHMLCINRLTGW